MLWWWIIKYGFYLGVALWAWFTMMDVKEAFEIAMKLLGLG